MTDRHFQLLAGWCERMQGRVQAATLLVLVSIGAAYIAPLHQPAVEPVKRVAVIPKPRTASTATKDPWKVARRDRCIEYRIAQKLDGSVCWDDGRRVHATGISSRGVPVDYTCDEKRCRWGN